MVLNMKLTQLLQPEPITLNVDMDDVNHRVAYINSVFLFALSILFPSIFPRNFLFFSNANSVGTVNSPV